MAQILNINMNSEIIRNLVTGYIKDSHHDFFKTNEVFKGIWMSTRSHVGGGVGADKSDSKRRRTEGGQDGGSSMESYTVEPTFFENVIIMAGLEEELRIARDTILSAGRKWSRPPPPEIKELFCGHLIDGFLTNSDFYQLDETGLMEKIEFCLAFNVIYGPKAVDYSLGYITEDEFYEESGPEPEPGDEMDLDVLLDELRGWTTKIDEATTLRVFLNNNYLSPDTGLEPEPEPEQESSMEIEPEPEQKSRMKIELPLGDAKTEADYVTPKRQSEPRTRSRTLSSSLRSHRHNPMGKPPKVGHKPPKVGGSSRDRVRSLNADVAHQITELQGELKIIHKMITVWDGLIGKMKGYESLHGDEQELFRNLNEANNSQDTDSQLFSSFVFFDRDTVASQLMTEITGGGQSTADGFNVVCIHILDEEPNHLTVNKLNKINKLFKKFNNYSISGKGKLTSPGDDLFNKFISKRWKSVSTVANSAVQFVFKKIFNKKSSGIELTPDDISVIDKFQALIMKHGWFEALGCLPGNVDVLPFPDWLESFRERVCDADVQNSPKMQGIGDNQFSTEFSKSEYGIDFMKTGVWEMKGSSGAEMKRVSAARGPEDLISIINNSKLVSNSGDNASLRKPYTTPRPKTIQIFDGVGKDANCNAPNVADPGPNCSKLKDHIAKDSIKINVTDPGDGNYSVLYQLDNITQGRTTDLRNCTMTVKINYNGKGFDIDTSVSNKSLSKNTVLKEMLTRCKQIVDDKINSAAPPANDYKGILMSLVQLFVAQTITHNDLKPIVEICLRKLFGDHGQELFAVGMLVDDENRSGCNSMTLAGNDRISHCRCAYMLKHCPAAMDHTKEWAEIYNSAAGYNMLYKNIGVAAPPIASRKKINRKTRNKSKKNRKKTIKSKRRKKKTKSKRRKKK